MNKMSTASRQTYPAASRHPSIVGDYRGSRAVVLFFFGSFVPFLYERSEFQNLFSVCSSPVDSPAGRTVLESGSSLIDIRRNSFPNGLLGDQLEWGITLHAAREEPVEIDLLTQILQYFDDLVDQIVVLNPQVAHRALAVNQTGIPSQCDAIFCLRAANDCFVIDLVVIGNVITEDAQPFGEAAQHDIRQESGFSPGGH